MPPLMGQLAPSTGMDRNEQGNGSDGSRQQLEAVMGQIRELGEQVSALGSKVPAFAPEVQQIQQIVKRLIVKAAQVAPQQTASAAQLPMGGSQ